MHEDSKDHVEERDHMMPPYSIPADDGEPPKEGSSDTSESGVSPSEARIERSSAEDSRPEADAAPATSEAVPPRQTLVMDVNSGAPGGVSR